MIVEFGRLRLMTSDVRNAECGAGQQTTSAATKRWLAKKDRYVKKRKRDMTDS